VPPIERKKFATLREIARMLVLSQDVAESLRQAIQTWTALSMSKTNLGQDADYRDKEDSTKAETKQLRSSIARFIRKILKALRHRRGASQSAEDRMQKRALCSAPARMQKRSARKRHRSRTMRSSIWRRRAALWRSNWQGRAGPDQTGNALAGLKELQGRSS